MPFKILSHSPCPVCALRSHVCLCIMGGVWAAVSAVAQQLSVLVIKSTSFGSRMRLSRSATHDRHAMMYATVFLWVNKLFTVNF